MVNRFVDAVGSAVQRAQAAERSELEIQVDRVREDQRLTESLLHRALREIEALRAEVQALRAGGLVAVPAPAVAAPTQAVPVLAPTPVAQVQAPVAAPAPVPAALGSNNPSAQAKAAGEVLDIDRTECIGCGTCVEHENKVFWLNEDEGKAYVQTQGGDLDGIQDAIDACPVTCISWQAPDA